LTVVCAVLRVETIESTPARRWALIEKGACLPARWI
jgi:hypothetical protein